MPQSLALVYIHAVFSTKLRAPVLHPDWRADLHGCIGSAINDLGCQTLSVGGVADHVHLLF